MIVTHNHSVTFTGLQPMKSNLLDKALEALDRIEEKKDDSGK